MNYNQRKEVIDGLNDLEAKYPVEQWQLGGIHIWPILKVKLFFIIFAQVNNTHPICVKSDGNSSAKKAGRRVQRLAKAIAYFIRLKLPKTDFVFSGANSHRVNFEGEFINRYFDPMMAYLKDNNKSCIGIEYDSDHRSISYEKFDDLIHLFRPPRIAFSDLATDEDFIDFITEIGTLFSVDKEELISVLAKTVKSVLQWKKLFLYVFEKSKPKYCFGLCYYSAAMWGMNAAAQEAGVISVDMQHGTQGSLHAAYSFSKLPSTGSYQILPNEFWCWDDLSYNHLQSWLGNSNHRVKLSGNPWYEYFLSKPSDSPTAASSSLPMILYTLQPSKPIINDYIIQTIKETRSHFSWWLRLHPRLAPSDKLELMQTLRKNDLIGSVEVEKATEMPLPELLMRSSLHISKFSGSIIEAAEVGVFSVILEQIGIETFRTVIERGDALGIEEPSVDALVRTIKNSVGKKSASRNELTFKVLLDEIC